MILEESCLSRIPLFLYIGALFYERVTTGTGHIAWILITIFAGSILLALPIATQSGQATPYIDALFTATTSVCVTGLIVETTMTHWSIFGQAVIILLVQIGGLGVITITTGMFFMLRKRITLGNRMLIQESMGLNTMTGLVPLVKKILIGTGIIEGIGAVLYADSVCAWNLALDMEYGQQSLIQSLPFVMQEWIL